MIQGYADAGFDTLRVPVAWSNMMEDNYTISDKYLSAVQEVVDWAIDCGLYVILNLHYDGGWLANFPTDKENCMEKYKRIWTQVSDAFADYSDYLVFESQNEELGWESLWNRWGAEPMSNVYGALYSTLATDDPNQRKSMRYIGSSIGRIFYLMDKAERFEADKCSGRYNVFVVNDLMGQASAVENARRQALAAANDLMRVYSMLDVKLNRSLLDNIMLLGLHHAVEPLEVGVEQENWEIP